MSLSTDGVWKAGVWATTVWGQCVWYEPSCVTPAPSGGGGLRVRHYTPELPKRKKLKLKVDLDEEIKKALRRSRDEELKRVAEKASKNAIQIHNIRRLALELEKEIQTKGVQNEISDREVQKRINRLRKDEEDIVAIILMHI